MPDKMELKDILTLFSAAGGLISALIMWYVIAKGKEWKEQVTKYFSDKLEAVSRDFKGEIEKSEKTLEKQLTEIKSTMVTGKEADLRFKNMELQIENKLAKGEK